MMIGVRLLALVRHLDRVLEVGLLKLRIPSACLLLGKVNLLMFQGLAWTSTAVGNPVILLLQGLQVGAKGVLVGDFALSQRRC